GQYRHAFDLPAVPRRGFVFAVQLVDVDRRFLVHIDDGDVAVGAETDRAFLRIDLPDFGGIFRSDFDVLIERQASFVDFGQDQRHAGFHAAETRDAIPDCRLGKLAVDIRAFL